MNFLQPIFEDVISANVTLNLELCKLAVSFSSPPRCLHGKCIATNSAYMCKCIEGYMGTYCDRTNDSSNPCRVLKCSHGQCKISSHGEPYCECDSNYSGEHCDRGWYNYNVSTLYYCPVFSLPRNTEVMRALKISSLSSEQFSF